MAKAEIAKPTDTDVARPRDIFSAMRGEMDRMFERFEHGFPRFPHLFRADHASVMVPEVDVRENATAITSRRNCRVSRRRTSPSRSPMAS